MFWHKENLWWWWWCWWWWWWWWWLMVTWRGKIGNASSCQNSWAQRRWSYNHFWFLTDNPYISTMNWWKLQFTLICWCFLEAGRSSILGSCLFLNRTPVFLVVTYINSCFSPLKARPAISVTVLWASGCSVCLPETSAQGFAMWNHPALQIPI